MSTSAWVIFTWHWWHFTSSYSTRLEITRQLVGSVSDQLGYILSHLKNKFKKGLLCFNYIHNYVKSFIMLLPIITPVQSI